MKVSGKTGLATLAVLLVMAGNALAVGTGSVDRTSGWYPAGTNLTVTAQPAAGDALKGWGGDTNNATFGTDTITFLVDTSKSITATFADIMHEIIASAGANGAISPSGTNAVAQGDSLEFTITPDPNHHIADVLVDSASVGATNSYTFSNVVAAHTIAAQFAINTYEVNFLAGAHGTITGGDANQTIDHGSDAIPPTITADAGYSFADWDGSYVNVTSDLNLTALYTTNEYTLTFDSAGGSTVDPITQLYTTAVTAPADPEKTGYTFAGWDPVIPATMPLDGGTHTAQWTANDYSFIVRSEHGTPNPAETNYYEYGMTVEFAMTDSPVIIPSNSMFEATGWVSTGSLASGTGTNDSFVITNDTTMTWQWSTNYWIELNTAGE